MDKSTGRNDDNRSCNQSKAADKPEPDNFDTFVPWACNQLQIDTSILVTKIQQHEYVSAAVTDRSKPKPKSKAQIIPSQTHDKSDLDKEEILPVIITRFDKIVNVNTVYDSNDHLVQIKFEKNKRIPQILMKVFGLTVRFHQFLTSLVINKGLDKYVMHELEKLLPMSRITELYLDDTYLQEANYYILLQKSNTIKHLSLRRCKLGDAGIEEICKQLIYPAPASNTLSALNLSTNRITNVGAKYLANALRSNRQLSYLNLAGNMITDEGAVFIFESLKEFTLIKGELLDLRSRYMKYLLQKSAMVDRIVRELKIAEFEKKAARRKSTKPSPVSSKKSKGDETELSYKSTPNSKEMKLSILTMESVFYEKAELISRNTIGEFEDPYSNKNTFVRNTEVHCYGNNTLCYLNLAYNSLTYIGIKKLLQILLYQKMLSRKPRGLLNVLIEGNNIPVRCIELMQIDDLLEMGLMSQGRLSSAKKKPVQKFNIK